MKFGTVTGNKKFCFFAFQAICRQCAKMLFRLLFADNCFLNQLQLVGKNNLKPATRVEWYGTKNLIHPAGEGGGAGAGV